jgi:hypothetical protein
MEKKISIPRHADLRLCLDIKLCGEVSHADVGSYIQTRPAAAPCRALALTCPGFKEREGWGGERRRGPTRYTLAPQPFRTFLYTQFLVCFVPLSAPS